jgi:hypothetical protein
MANHIIVPHQTRWEKLRDEVKSFSPQVKLGLVIGAVTLLIALSSGIGGIVGWITTYRENSKLRNENAAQEKKIKESETVLIPF